MSRSSLAKCPCGKTPILASRIRNNETLYYVLCPECGCEGREATSEIEAELHWIYNPGSFKVKEYLRRTEADQNETT